MKSIVILSLVLMLTGCSKINEKITYIKALNEKAELINHYEVTALNLAKKNREMEIEISDLKFEVQKLKTENSYMKMKMEKGEGEEGLASAEAKTPSRAIASVVPPEEDVVKQNVFKWNVKQLVAMAEKEFDEKNFEKSAQYYQTLIQAYPDDKSVDDAALFRAGTAAFEAGKTDWTLSTMQTLMKKYPQSKYYRGAKLWTALTNLKLGKKKEFFATVEEFRKKYRNTQEWTILSAHYENIMQKYKE